ncbi:MAG: glycerophosphodiester phosphodiesterase [Nocardioidaceae bacterium]|nr:glycerophosphodiester phosphodiesterase [Nocardioidaceae bacterium]
MDRPVTGYPYLDEAAGTVIAMAHRGGALHPELRGLENTLHAFEHAVALGYRYLETDVHATSDGHLVAFHDEVLDRVTDRAGPLASTQAAEVALARIGGEHAVPGMADLLEAFPDCQFNIDLKSPAAVRPLAALLDRAGAHDRVLVGSFSLSSLRQFRALTGGRVATSAAPAEAAAFLTLPVPRLARLVTRGRVAALQVPVRRGRLRIVDAGLVRRAHAAGAHVHVWTVDEPAEMDRLVALGVDGLITDRTDLLKDVLVRRGLWEDAA